ncbi:MAG: hypothetical protein IPG67_01320 [Acidobacteria bacterium]|nr:hypothetical protein [Acidobacteriota bacterium]
MRGCGAEAGSFLFFASLSVHDEFSPRLNADGDGDLAEDEVATETIVDGTGRVLKTRTENPRTALAAIPARRSSTVV